LPDDKTSASADVAESLTNLGGLLESTGRYVEAKPLFVEALQLKRTSEVGGVEIAHALNNVGLVCSALGQMDEAGAVFTEALDFLKQELPSGHKDIARCINNLVREGYSSTRD